MKSKVFLTIRTEEGVTVVALEEPRLVYAGLDSFVEQVAGRLEGESPRVVLDLSAVNYIDSAAIGCLMDLYRRAAAAGGRIVLSGLQERVGRMLRMTGAHEFIGLHPSAAAAVAALAAGGGEGQ